MYTYCTIRYVDDGYELPVIIKATDAVDEYDDMIFFYGLSRDELDIACETGEVLEGEWQVVSIEETLDALI